MRSSVVLPQPDGPRSVNSSPSAMSIETRSTARTPPNRFSTSRRRMFTRPLGLLPDRLDVGAELDLERFRALRGHGLVVDVGDLAVEVRPHTARELHRHLGVGAGRALHLVLRGDREEPALHEDLLAPLA